MRAIVTPRAGVLAGLAGLTAWIALYAISALAMASGPGYDVTRNYLSDLGNPASPAPWAFNAACLLGGILAIPFGLALGDALGGRGGRVLKFLIPLAGLSLVGVGAFPEGSPYGLHGLVSLLFFVLLTASQGAMVLPALRAPTFRPLGGWVTAGAFVLSAALIISFFAGVGNDHLAEHLGVYGGLAWQLSSALYLWRSPTVAARTVTAPV